MFHIENLAFDRGLFLAPMEDVTDISYRMLCKEMGADMVYTEFINADGLTRGCKRGWKKMSFLADERPIGIQIYGSDISTMIEAAKIVERENPDVIDINAGCWVKKIAHRGAGAGLLRDPKQMEKMAKSIVEAVSLPVTVKTRLGWDETSICIEEIAERLEAVGVRALTVHCRTRSQGHTGKPDWSWIDKVKKKVDIPIILNGGVLTADDVMRAFSETNADAVMLARGVIGSPWIFREAREKMLYGEVKTVASIEERIKICLRHLRIFIEYRGEKSIPAFRKYYLGYFKGFANASHVRIKLMSLVDYSAIEETLLAFLEDATYHTLPLTVRAS